jgi:ACS family hexuronate transporter-like MFS transporter
MRKNPAVSQSHFRWFILSLLFLATTVLYMDRSALGILAPDLQRSVGWNEEQYGYINTAFMIAYAICFLIMGTLVDRIGTKKGYMVSIGIWSLATAAHALAASWVGFALARFTLAVGQSGNFPSAIKAVAEWFPRKERALAVSIFNGGSNMGTILSPLIIPGLVLMAGNWRVAFLWTVPISLAWLLIWSRHFKKPENHRRVSAGELAFINSDTGSGEKSEKMPWKAILPHRGTWAIAVGKFIADPVWWFYLFWGAKFLNEKFGVNLKEIGLPFFTIYLVSWGLGMVLGWFSSKLLKSGMSINRGRKLGMLACAICAVPVVLVPRTDSLWMAVSLIALAAGGHCGWSANIFSLMSDIFPRRATASVAGFGGFAGAVGGAMVAFTVGKVIQHMGTDGYGKAFMVAGAAYLFALGLIHLIVPQIKPME